MRGHGKGGKKWRSSLAFTLTVGVNHLSLDVDSYTQCHHTIFQQKMNNIILCILPFPACIIPSSCG